MFKVEALSAAEGDCLLVHFGSARDPQLIVVDGGPGEALPGVPITNALIQRLDELQTAQTPPGRLRVEIIVASHIDDDHIVGLVELCDATLDGPLSAPGLDVKTLWHNTLDDLLLAAAQDEGDDEFVLAATLHPPEDLPGRQEVIATVPKANDLLEKAELIGWPHNVPFLGAVRSDDHATGRPLTFGPLTLTVVGPNRELLEKLKRKWQATEAAIRPDPSQYNLSSIVLLLEIAERKALLTGDGLAKNILSGLEAAGRLDPDAPLVLDLLKVPHHGSNHNSTPEFFRRLPAKHYVISANGKHGNPDMETLRWLLDSRTDNDFAIHLTTRDLIAPAGSAPVDYLLAQQERRGFELVFRADDALSLTVDLSP